MKPEAMWDGIAKNWDKPGVSLGENDIRIIEKTKKYLNSNAVVLDFGCATGTIALDLAGDVKEAHGIDLSSKMIEIAKRKADERNLRNTAFVHGTIFDESLREESFDLILALSIIHLLEDLPRVMGRIYRLLKPNGLFVSATPCLGEKTFVSLLLNLPVFLLSKIGILPHINFLSVPGLEATITDEKFQILEVESLLLRPIVEHLIIARKIPEK